MNIHIGKKIPENPSNQSKGASPSTPHPHPTWRKNLVGELKEFSVFCSILAFAAPDTRVPTLEFEGDHRSCASRFSSRLAKSPPPPLECSFPGAKEEGGKRITQQGALLPTVCSLRLEIAFSTFTASQSPQHVTIGWFKERKMFENLISHIFFTIFMMKIGFC